MSVQRVQCTHAGCPLQRMPPPRAPSLACSLGAALSELCGVWSAITWPSADVTVANQGGPIPGSKDFKLLFEALVGRAYK